jgi:nucleotide-binding universal stress UspA family protein
MERSDRAGGTSGVEGFMTVAASRKKTSYIIVTTDFEAPARRAFMYGVKLAITLSARLNILHVIKTASDSSAVERESRQLGSLKTSALLNLGRLTRIAEEAGALARPQLLYGVPAACILEAVKLVPVKLIVMGTEGRTGWDRLRLGSTALAIVQRAPCPVLTVHGGLARDVVRHSSKVRLHRLLIATDFSRPAEAALQTAGEIATTLKSTIFLLHAVEPSEDKTHAERMLSKRIERLRRQHIEADGLCVHGDPVEVILAQAAAWQADVIAVGTQGRRGLSRLALGSVAEALLKRAGCPVLTVAKTRRHVAANHSRTTRSHGS